MSRDLDARGRRAAANLRTTMARAELTSVAPGTARPRRVFFGALRPALILGLLVIGSAVGVALVVDFSPAPLPPPVSTTTTTEVVTTTQAPTTTTTPSTTTTAYVVPAPTSTTAPADVEPPYLDITSPEDGAELMEKTVAFEGVTEPGARVFAGKYEAEVDASGGWRIVLVLSEGSNVARFTARDEAGNESQAAVTVYYVVESPTTTTTVVEKEPAEFSAFSQFGSCSETPPYDIYYGTGEPGSVVEITSEYGSGSVVVGETGNWEKKIVFETAPVGKPFLVRVMDSYGRKAEFEFVYLP